VTITYRLSVTHELWIIQKPDSEGSETEGSRMKSQQTSQTSPFL